MTQDDKQKFSQALIKCAIVYSKDLTKEHLQILWNELKEFDIEDIELAISAHMKKGKFFPVIADIVDFIPNKNLNRKKSGEILVISGKKYKVLS